MVNRCHMTLYASLKHKPLEVGFAYQNKHNLAIFTPRKFKRVLELPSENWLELAQDWCCHGSSNLTSMAGALEPDENDCFVGDYYIKVNCSSAVPDSLQIIPVSE